MAYAAAGPEGKVDIVFHALHYKGKTLRVTTATVGFVNSKGHPSADEQERPLGLENGALASTKPEFVLDEGAELKLQVSPAKP